MSNITQCSGINKTGERKGQQCSQSKMNTGGVYYCSKHINQSNPFNPTPPPAPPTPPTSHSSVSSTSSVSSMGSVSSPYLTQLPLSVTPSGRMNEIRSADPVLGNAINSLVDLFSTGLRVKCDLNTSRVIAALQNVEMAVRHLREEIEQL
jgi:hypothetical protein